MNPIPPHDMALAAAEGEWAEVTALLEFEGTAGVLAPVVAKEVVLGSVLWRYRPGAECSPSGAR